METRRLVNFSPHPHTQPSLSRTGHCASGEAAHTTCPGGDPSRRCRRRFPKTAAVCEEGPRFFRPRRRAEFSPYRAAPDTAAAERWDSEDPGRGRFSRTSLSGRTVRVLHVAKVARKLLEPHAPAWSAARQFFVFRLSFSVVTGRAPRLRSASRGHKEGEQHRRKPAR